jgi:hypothetical protein
MLWIVMLAILGLAGVAFGWVTLQTSRERVTISFETEKVRPALEKVKQAAGTALEKGREFLHSRHS